MTGRHQRVDVEDAVRSGGCLCDAVRVTGETRHWKHRHFCPTCGGSVFARWDDEIEVHLGTLDEPSRFTPTYESWTVRREDWLPAFAGMRGFVGNREE